IDVYPSLRDSINIRRWIRRIDRTIRAAGTEANAEYPPLEFVAGEYRSLFFWSLVARFAGRQPRVTIIDDGTASLRIDRSSSAAPPSARERSKALAAAMFGLSIGKDLPIEFFSVYDLRKKLGRHDTFVSNTYERCKANMASLPSDDSTVYIIGSPILEAGVITGDDIGLTKAMIAAIRHEMPAHKIVYVPHRRERQEKLHSVQTLVEVRSLGYPFEAFSAMEKKNVRFVAGFYSSVFDNLIAIYGSGVQITSYTLPAHLVSNEWKDFVDSVYKNYQRHQSGNFQISPIGAHE
ncbi:MAG: hypothetical protein ACREFM_23040, partial [Hypericibacter sp.]